MERTLRFSTKLGIKVLEAVVEGLIDGALKVLDPEKLRLLIDRDWYIIQSIFHSAYNVPYDVYEGLSPQEIQKAEQTRRALTKAILPVLGMARSIASRFPIDAVEGKVTPEWLIKRGETRFPEIVEVWKEAGGKGERWLQKQSKEIADYLTGRTVYSPFHKGMIPVEELKRAVQEATLQSRR